MDERNRIHKFYMHKLLIALVDHPKISQGVYFKGGTAASMLGYLDRFSIDLDFDIKESLNTNIVRAEVENIARDLDFDINNRNKKSLFFVVKYKTKNINQRNTLKLSFFEKTIRANTYKPQFLSEIDRLVNCQTIETMFANKLVAVTDRYKKHRKIAGRDIYDTYFFLKNSYPINKDVIKERTGNNFEVYIKELIAFINEKVTEKIITEDLNMLLPLEKFQKIRKNLKNDTILLLKNLV